MPRILRNRLMGRASLVALALLAVAFVVGGFALLRKASAQGTSVAVHPISFAPVMLAFHDEPQTQTQYPGVHDVMVSMFLPAVQHDAVPFRIQAVGSDGRAATMVCPSDPSHPTMSFFDVFMTIDESSGEMVLNLRNQRTGEWVVVGSHDDVFVARLLPAVQRNGKVLMPLSLGETLMGFRNTRLGDGSVQPIPFQYGMNSSH